MINGAPGWSDELTTKPLIIAHRGGIWPGVPGEQTQLHFERAIAAGVDFIEVDLRRTADGCIICHHDPDYAGLEVATHTFAEISQVARGEGFLPPATLDTLLKIARGRVGLDLEIKVGGFERQLLTEVYGGFDPSKVIFKSFNDQVLRRIKALEPDSYVGLLLGVKHPRYGILSRLGEVFPGWRLYRSGADFVCPHHNLLRAGFVWRQHLSGRKVFVWTVNDPGIMKRLVGLVDGIITDDPVGCRAVITLCFKKS